MGRSAGTIIKDFQACKVGNKTTNFLKNDIWFDIDPPTNRYKEKKKVKLVLKLCQMVSTDEEIKTLCESSSMSRLNDIAISIETRAFEKMWVLEGKDSAKEKAKNDKAGSKKKKPTYIPMGIRLHNYKKNVLHNAQASLCERPEEEDTGNAAPLPLPEVIERRPIPNRTAENRRIRHLQEKLRSDKSKSNMSSQRTLDGMRLTVDQEREALDRVPKK